MINKQSYAQIKFDNSRKKLSSSLKDLEIAIKEKIEEITSEYLNIVDVKESLIQKEIVNQISNNNSSEEEKNNLILENNNLLKRNIELEEEKNNLILENCNFDKKNNDLEEDIKKLNENIEILTLQNKELAVRQGVERYEKARIEKKLKEFIMAKGLNGLNKIKNVDDLLHEFKKMEMNPKFNFENEKIKSKDTFDKFNKQARKNNNFLSEATSPKGTVKNTNTSRIYTRDLMMDSLNEI